MKKTDRPFFVEGELLAVLSDIELPKVCLLTGGSVGLIRKQTLIQTRPHLGWPRQLNVSGWVNEAQWSIREARRARIDRLLFGCFAGTLGLLVFGLLINSMITVFGAVLLFFPMLAMFPLAERLHTKSLYSLAYHSYRKPYHFLAGLSPEVLAELTRHETRISGSRKRVQ